MALDTPADSPRFEFESMPDLCVVRVAQELISLQGKTNFFEKRVGEYAKAGVMSSEKGEHTREISGCFNSMDDDF